MRDRSSKSGWDWLEAEDGSVLFKPGRHVHAVLISQSQLKAINQARTAAYITALMAFMLVFAMNGRWWHEGLNPVTGLGVIAMLAGAAVLVTARAFRIKGRIVASAAPAPVDIEKGSVTKAAAILLRRFSSPALALFVAVALFLDIWLVMDIRRLILLGPDASELHGRRIPGPLSGLIALVPLGYLTYRIAVELLRRTRMHRK